MKMHINEILKLLSSLSMKHSVRVVLKQSEYKNHNCVTKSHEINAELEILETNKPILKCLKLSVKLCERTKNLSATALFIDS